MDRDPFELVGDTLDGQFRVVAFAGEGDLSVVYRGHHVGVDAPVAIKCLDLPTTLDGARVRPLVDAFRTASRLHHTLARGNLNIAQSLGSGSTLARATGMIVPFFVREWFEGESLQTELERRRDQGKKGRTLEEVVALLDPVAEALAYAHGQGTAHLSLNPSNLFVAARKDRRALKVLDFGVAHAMNELAREIPPEPRPPTGLRALFPAYAAPEQLDKAVGKPGTSTDVYALALVMMELLSDRVVMAEEETPALVARALDEQRRPTPQNHGLELPRNLELVLTRAVARGPERRQRNAKDLWNEVKTSLRGTTSRGMSAAKAPSRPAPLAASPAAPVAMTPPAAPSEPTIPVVPAVKLPFSPLRHKETIPFGFDPRAVSVPTHAPSPAMVAIEHEPEQPPVHVVATPPPPHPVAAPLPPVIVTVDSPLPRPVPFAPPVAPSPGPAAYALPPLAPRDPTFVILDDPPPPRRSRFLVFVLSAVIGGSLGVAVMVLWKRPATPTPVDTSSAPAPPAPVEAPSAPASVSWPLAPPAAPTASTTPMASAQSTPSAAPLPFFPTGPAKQALDTAAHDIGRCRLGKVWGTASANVTFGNDGAVSHVAVGIPFTGTSTGQCVADALQVARVAAFAGKPAVVSYKFFIPFK